ncbi:glycosyltransferase family 2 protein [archaeon]|nr:glycosyltransferase family 2 protein [archaeon]MBL7057573.1 glycosyltransferase family 2 protein [Candidatus Woesearchaeota archaeon]
MSILANVLGVITAVFVLYLILFLIIGILPKKKIKFTDKLKQINIIIPLFNEEKVIHKTIDSVLKQEGNLIRTIILVLDNCTDNSAKICEEYARKYSNIKIINKKDVKPSKVGAVLKALEITNDKYFAIIDADTVLAKTAIRETYEALASNGADFFTAIVDPYKNRSFIYKVISWDRMFRQRFIQVGKDAFDMANFPGCFGVMKTDKFKALLENSILEDFLMTLKAMRENSKIKILPKILAYEQEKSSIRDVFFQRIRWTVGNMELSKQFLKTLKTIKPNKKIALLAYPIMWYFIYYYIAITLVLSVITLNKTIIINFLIMTLSTAIILVYSRLKFRDLNLTDFVTIPTYLIIFPLIITVALVPASLITIKNKHSNMMMSKKYFER